MSIKIKTKGFVLIEMIIYTALFTIIMGGLVVTSHQLSESTTDLEYRVATQEEINFVTKKIDWLFSGASSFEKDGNALEVINNGITYELEFISGDNKITLDGEDLTTVNVEVENFDFIEIGTPPVGLNITLTVDGQTVSFNKYLRI